MNLRLLTLFVSLLAAASASGQAEFAVKPPVATPIKHVVIIFQENRTPDNLFHDSVLIARGADIATMGVNSKGQVITLNPTSLTQNYDLSHTHASFLAQYDNGKMDGADKIVLTCASNAVNCPCSHYATAHGLSCPLADPQFYYIDPTEVAPYFALAETYTFGDRMFQSNQGPSFPAHQYIISGTSTMGSNAPGGNTNLFFAENLATGGVGGLHGLAGCAAPPASLVKLIDISNPDPVTNETQSVYPCAEHQTLMDLLDKNKITWKYYAPGPTSIWTGPNAIEHLCGPNAAPPNATACTSSDWTNNVIQPNYTQVLTDISGGTLASVSWVIPGGNTSDHAVATNGSGPSWVASVVNAIGTSQYWQDTAIILTWDDWGGWYDHVAPTLVANNSYEEGFRVPLVVISPYARAAHISHVHHDFGSILKFIENTFGLHSLGYEDATSDNLSDCFNYKQKPLVFKTVPAALPASFFINDKTPPTDPDDD